MATWLLPRARVFPWLQARSHLNMALQAPSPASLEIDTMPYPTSQPDMAVFEPMSDEYTSASASDSAFTPLSSSETLATLVLKGNFRAAESLRQEMLSHHIPIQHDVLYLRAALHTIKDRRTKGSAQARSDAFQAWLSLAPDRHEKWLSFHDIRHRLFGSMDHLNLTLVYRFGLVLASKGYHTDNAAMQVVSTLAKYALPSVVDTYFREAEAVSRDYYANKGTVLPPDVFVDAYSLAIRTMALAGKSDAALDLISITHARGIRIPDFTLNIVARHAPDRQVAIDAIQAMYPSWTMQVTMAHPVRVECASGHTTDIVALAARLRSLRTAMKSPCPPSPHALHSFITSYRSLGRTRALRLLRSLAYRHSPKSASTWAFTEMLHHRARQEPLHLLCVFAHHFHFVGVPRKTLLSLIRARRQQTRKEHAIPHWPMRTRLWPSAYHTALVWDALVSLVPTADKTRLYTLLLSLVRQSKQPSAAGTQPEGGVGQPRVQLAPTTFDAVHFSPFVSVWARRSPVRAVGVLQDMIALGIAPSVPQWSMVARGYAQHDDPSVALRILDQLEDTWRTGEGEGDGDGDGDGDGGDAEVLLGVHTNVLRGFVLAGDVPHAHAVEQRLARFGYRAGDRPKTDASIAHLRALEARLGP